MFKVEVVSGVRVGILYYSIQSSTNRIIYCQKDDDDDDDGATHDTNPNTTHTLRQKDIGGVVLVLVVSV